MADTYELHGGPWHGQKVAVETGRDHFHILNPSVDLTSLLDGALAEQPSTIRHREGQYSRIKGMPGHMEWDGWRTHD